jgi:hypothetical protein
MSITNYPPASDSNPCWDSTIWLSPVGLPLNKNRSTLSTVCDFPPTHSKFWNPIRSFIISANDMPPSYSLVESSSGPWLQLLFQYETEQLEIRDCSEIQIWGGVHSDPLGMGKAKRYENQAVSGTSVVCSMSVNKTATLTAHACPATRRKSKDGGEDTAASKVPVARRITRAWQRCSVSFVLFPVRGKFLHPIW